MNSYNFVSFYLFLIYLYNRFVIIQLSPTESSEGQKIIDVNFYPTDQILANEYLPIWTVHENNPAVLQREEHVMRELGQFSMYQCQKTSSAAVKFDKENQFNGIIDSRYIIERSSLDTKLPLFKRKSSRFFNNLNPNESELQLNVISIRTLDKKIRRLKSYRVMKKTAYVETLVLVNYDMVQKLQKKSNEYVPVVSYILTLFNIIDMLYSKINKPIIKFNLAGIIIGSDSKSFSRLMNNCIEQVRRDGKLEDELDVDCANTFISTFCGQQKQQIPPGSYDVVILLTRYGLHKYEYNAVTSSRKLKSLGGLASSPPYEYYNLMTTGHMRPLVATISDHGEFESFPIIAHEIAHLLTVEHDPSIETGKLMQSRGKFDQNSLSWSELSEKRFNIFFQSPDCCIFMNKPRSLYPRGPRKMLNANEQCRCYGYRSAIIPMCNRLVGISTVDCAANINCINVKNGEVFDGPIYMDGTQCGINQVCWNEECVNVHNE